MTLYRNSIAQKNVKFPIETIVDVQPGGSYSKALVFVDLDMAADFVSAPTAGVLITLTRDDFAEKVKGELLRRLSIFFNLASTAEVNLCPIDSVTDLETYYAEHKYVGYFKFAWASDDAAFEENNLKLAELCTADDLDSFHWVTVSDVDTFTGGGLAGDIIAGGYETRIIYHPDEDAAFTQLADSLGVVNSTGVAVGNDIDMHQFAGLNPSGDAGQNLTVAQCKQLDDLRVGYITAIDGDGGMVCAEGSLTAKGTLVGAKWLRNYIEYMCKVKAANYLTQRNIFFNNSTYQAVLAILSAEAQKFVELGRLTDYVLTAPPFNKLPNSGDVLTVPDAWQARYVDNIREVTIYGKLYVTLPRR